MTPTIICKYTCGVCGLYRISVNVQARMEEDIMDWMDKILTPTLVADHEFRSPDCHPSRFSEVMIPTPEGTSRIGGVVEN